MAEYITRIRTESGDMQIDYKALANLPKPDSTLSQSGEFAEAKAIGERIAEINTNIKTVVTNLEQHTHDVVNSSDDGLMSANDKNKLDNIEDGANHYVLPVADKSVVGGVTTTSEVTSSDGLTACPIISGVPYYNNVTLEKLGVTSTVEEINKLAGMPSVAEKPKPVSVILSEDAWLDNRQVVSVDGVAENSIIFVSAEPSIGNYEVCNESMIRCVSQASGELTFECLYKPSSDVTMNVAIFA